MRIPRKVKRLLVRPRNLFILMSIREGLPFAAYRGMVTSLKNAKSAYVVGPICGIVAALLPYATTHDPLFLYLIGFMIVVSVVRFMAVLKNPLLTRKQVVDYEVVYGLIASCAFILALGLVGALSVFLTEDYYSRFYSCVVVVGSVSVMAGRNNGRPMVVVLQLLASICLMGASYLLHGWGVGDYKLMGMGLVLFVWIPVFWSMTRSNYGNLRSNILGRLLSNERSVEFNNAIQSIVQGVCTFDRRGRVSVVNDRFKDDFALSDDVKGMSASAVFNLLGSRLALPQAENHVFRDTMREGLTRKLTATYLSRDGRAFEFTFNPAVDGGVSLAVADVTERRRSEQRIEYMAHFDQLTELPNRGQFRDKLHATITERRSSSVAVLMIDLDRFKEVNDTLGHPIGDRLLQSVALRITKSVGKGNLVARLGGDEFAVILNVEGGETVLASAVRDLIESVGRPYQIENQRISIISATVGSAVFPTDGNDVDTLVSHADMALYAAKRQERGTWMRFMYSMVQETVDRNQLRDDLALALATEGLTVNYQPIVDVSTGSVVMFEALVRWHHPTRGFVRPDIFVKIAEESGHIDALSAFVVNRACKDALTWPDPIRVAVNYSPAQFRLGKVYQQVVDALESTGLPGHRLEVEITEGLQMANDNSVDAELHRIKETGVTISIDDYGEGFANLRSVARFPCDKIKLDMSFVKGIHRSRENAAILRSTYMLAKDLGLAFVCEGVEDQADYEHLVGDGVVLMQGWKFSKPVPLGEVGAVILKFPVQGNFAPVLSAA